MLVTLSDRNVVEDTHFNGLAITDTAAKFGTLTDIYKYRALQFYVSSTLDQTATIAMQIKGKAITSGSMQSLTGASFTGKSITIPIGSAKLTFNLSDLGIDPTKGMPYQLFLVATCTTAPTTGSLTIVSWGVPN